MWQKLDNSKWWPSTNNLPCHVENKHFIVLEVNTQLTLEQHRFELCRPHLDASFGRWMQDWKCIFSVSRFSEWLFSSPLYILCENTVYNIYITYRVRAHQLSVLLLRLLANRRILVAKFLERQELHVDFELCEGLAPQLPSVVKGQLCVHTHAHIYSITFIVDIYWVSTICQTLETHGLMTQRLLSL